MNVSQTLDAASFAYLITDAPVERQRLLIPLPGWVILSIQLIHIAKASKAVGFAPHITGSTSSGNTVLKQLPSFLAG